VQVTNSTVEILLIDNNQVDSTLIDRLLSNVKGIKTVFRLTKIKEINEVLEFIQQKPPELIFYIFNPQEDSNSSISLKLHKLNSQDIPLILISTVVEYDITSLPLEVDDYLLWSDLSSKLLQKTILFALKRYQSRKKIALISHENIELSSQLLTTKNLFQTIVDNTSSLIWICDQGGNSTFFNQAWRRVLGKKIETRLNTNWMVNIHPQDLVKCQLVFNQALAKNQGFNISYRLKCFDSHYRWISNYAVPQFTVSGKFEGLVGYCFDITAHKTTEQKLIKRADSDRILAQITQKIHASLDLDQILQTTVAEVNQFLQAEKIQINRVDQGGKLTLLFESRLNNPPLRCDIGQPQRFPVVLFQNNLVQLSAGQIVTQQHVTQQQLDSPVIEKNHCSILLIPILSEQKLWGILCLEQCSLPREWKAEEIKLLERVAMELSVAIKQAKLYQQLEQANRELEQLSIVDDLTKIANRRKFDRYITAEWTRLAREQHPLSLILCDIDYFKLYNDTYGHQAGDRCLQAVAEAICQVIKRPADLVARYGGEEFVLVLPNTPLEGAKYLAQQVRLQIESLKLPHINSPIDLYVTLSLGVSCCIPEPNSSFQPLIATADKGLYQAKEMGRNRVVEYGIKPE